MAAEGVFGSGFSAARVCGGPVVSHEKARSQPLDFSAKSGRNRELIRLRWPANESTLDECLFGLLIEDVQVIGVEHGFNRLTRPWLGGGVHAGDELVSIRRQVREDLRA